MLLFLPLLLVLPLVLAELDTAKIASETGTAEIAFNSESDCKGNCKCPKGYTLVYDSDAPIPATCQRIIFTRRVKCNQRADDSFDRCPKPRRLVGACVKRSAEFRPYCHLPNYLQHACRTPDCEGRWHGEGESCGAIAINGDAYHCLKRVQNCFNPCDLKTACPEGFDPVCFEVKALGCKDCGVELDFEDGECDTDLLDIAEDCCERREREEPSCNRRDRGCRRDNSWGKK